MTEMGATMVGPRDGKAGQLGGIGVRFMAWSEQTGGGLSLVEHPMAPRALAAPLHRHSHEDEDSYVLEGRMGADFGGEVVFAGGGFPPVAPAGARGAGAAPRPRHSHEDEYSYVLEGRMGADFGGEIVYAGAGDLVFKPRGQWHAFWNAGEEPCRILEIISPGG